MDPKLMLNQATKAVPAVKWAVGVGGVLVVVGVVASNSVDPRLMLLGGVLIFFLMVLLVVFATVAGQSKRELRLAAVILTYSSLALAIALPALTLSSVFFRVPADLSGWLIDGSRAVTQGSVHHSYGASAETLGDAVDASRDVGADAGLGTGQAIDPPGTDEKEVSLPLQGASVDRAAALDIDRRLAHIQSSDIPLPAETRLATATQAEEAQGFRQRYPPRYPPQALRRREQGTVMIHVEVSAQGEPLSVRVNQSSGSRLLDDAAITAVKQWKFVPAKRGGVSVASETTVPIKFSLADL